MWVAGDVLMGMESDGMIVMVLIKGHPLKFMPKHNPHCNFTKGCGLWQAIKSQRLCPHEWD
jgi:hypothetical protein